MDPRDLLETYALPLASFATVCGLFVVWLVARRRERRRPRVRRSPTGPGAALALALDGDLGRARDILTEAVRGGGPEAIDALVGLVAVLRAEGDLGRARTMLDRLAARQGPTPWLDAMRLRIALDDGRLDDACRLVDAGTEVPLEMAIAALARGGRWADALRRYRSSAPRRGRDPRLEAALAAGCAAELQRAGQHRSARRALKRALSLDPEGVLPLAVAADLHPRDARRHQLAQSLDARLPGQGEAVVPEDVQQAQAAYADGRHEEAMGLLRDRLERDPRDWPVRRLYARWIVEAGRPDDWRAELAEIVGLLAVDDSEPAPVGCTRCGHVEPAPFAICPRCDAIGCIRVVARRRDDRMHGLPSSAGAALSDLLTAGDTPEAGPGAG